MGVLLRRGPLAEVPPARCRHSRVKLRTHGSMTRIASHVGTRSHWLVLPFLWPSESVGALDDTPGTNEVLQAVKGESSSRVPVGLKWWVRDETVDWRRKEQDQSTPATPFRPLHSSRRFGHRRRRGDSTRPRGSASARAGGYGPRSTLVSQIDQTNAHRTRTKQGCHMRLGSSVKMARANIRSVSPRLCKTTKPFHWPASRASLGRWCQYCTWTVDDVQKTRHSARPVDQADEVSVQ